MAQRRKQVEVDEETHRRLKVLAADAGLTIREFVRLMIEREWERFHVKQS